VNARANFIWDAPLELDGAQAHVLCEALDRLTEPRDRARDIADRIGPINRTEAADLLRAITISLKTDLPDRAELCEAIGDIAFELLTAAR
jgi:hypothetical protein